MDWKTIISHALTVNTNAYVKPALDGLSDDDIAKQPHDQCNSIGWILWHQSRAEDAILSNISGKPQTWIEGKWYEQFGMEADARHIGIGDSMEQVSAFQGSKETLISYAEAVREKTLDVLNSLSAEDLDRDVPSARGRTRKVAEYLGILMMDHFQHSGQITYLRGYFKGNG